MFQMLLFFVVFVGFILGVANCVAVSICERNKAKAKKARNAARMAQPSTYVPYNPTEQWDAMNAERRARKMPEHPRLFVEVVCR